MRTFASIPLVAALTLAGHLTSLTAAPAAVSGVSVSETVAAAERSAHFAAVNRQLELGGVLYGYIDIDGDVASGGAALSQLAEKVAQMNPMAALARQDFAAIFQELGLTELKAIGLSSVRAGDGFRNRVFFYTPGGQRGLMTMFGGAATSFTNTRFAPANTDLFFETQLDVPAGYEAVRKVVARIGGDGLVDTLEREIKKPNAEGVTPFEVIQQLSGRYTVALRLEPENPIVLPNGMSFPGVSLFMKADGLAGVFQKLLKEEKDLAKVTEGGRTFFEVTEAAPGTTLKPVFMFEDGAFVIGSTRAFALECLGRKGGLDGDATFKTALASVGPEGNGLTYVTPRFFAELRKTLTSVGEANAQAAMMVEMWSGHIPTLATPLVSARANLPDGILVRSFSHRSLKQQALIAGNPAVIGLMAAMAIPAFQKVRANSQEKAIQNNLRQFSAAAQQYMLEHAKTSASYADLVGPEEGKYIRELKPVAGEDYESLVVKADDEEISVTMSNGKEVSVRM